MKKVWLITGAGKGMGNAIARAALENGDFVIATTRKEQDFTIWEKYQDRVMTAKLDVAETEEAQIQAIVEEGVRKFGRIDVLVNNAGRGRITNFEETSEKNIRNLFDINVFGLMRVTRAVLPIMRRQNSGHIINIASAAGYAQGPVVYHTSKFAVTGFSVSLAFEVAPFGIKVTNAAPGVFRTGFYDKNVWGIESDIHIDDYDDSRWQTAFVEDALKQKQEGDPAKLANLIIEAANSENPPLHLPVGEDAVRAMDSYCEKIKEDCGIWKEAASRTAY
ncbi:MAG: SDR family NAD(P)-dependent oxidoreductase [Lachnospiraceae bacterium]|nr:SDR family NAD(P)-dependent oxidoreductase [Lachnospiraceae bacterium]